MMEWLNRWVYTSLLSWYLWFKGYRVGKTSTDEEFQACIDLIASNYEEDEARWQSTPRKSEPTDSKPSAGIDEAIAPSEILRVPRDAMTQIFATVRHQDELVGVIELVTTTDRFPLEHFMNVETPREVPRETIAELTRFFILRQHRKQNHLVSFGLLWKALQLSRAANVTHWYGCSPSWMLRSFRYFFRSIEFLEQREPTEFHLRYRAGHGEYFHERHGLVVYLIELGKLSISDTGWRFVKRFWSSQFANFKRWRRRKRRRHP